MLARGAVECLQSALVIETTAQQSQNYRLSEQLLYWGMKCHLVPRLYFQSNTALADASQLAHKLPRINIEMASGAVELLQSALIVETTAKQGQGFRAAAALQAI